MLWWCRRLFTDQTFSSLFVYVHPHSLVCPSVYFFGFSLQQLLPSLAMVEACWMVITCRLALVWSLAVNFRGFKTVCVQILPSPSRATPGKRVKSPVIKIKMVGLLQILCSFCPSEWGTEVWSQRIIMTVSVWSWFVVCSATAWST